MSRSSCETPTLAPEFRDDHEQHFAGPRRRDQHRHGLRRLRRPQFHRCREYARELRRPAQQPGAILSTLGNYGGPTDTRVPLPGSPAIDAADSGPACPATDQRGVSRPRGGGCDSGAVEANPGAHQTLMPTSSGPFITEVQLSTMITDKLDPANLQSLWVGLTGCYGGNGVETAEIEFLGAFLGAPPVVSFDTGAIQKIAAAPVPILPGAALVASVLLFGGAVAAGRRRRRERARFSR